MRLVLLLSCALASAGSFAAELPRVVETPPLQLSLDFAARTSPALSLPLTTAPTLELSRALAAGDSTAFYKAAVAAEYSIPVGDDHQERLFAEGAERAAADRAFARREQPAPLAQRVARSTKIDYEEFGRLIGQRSVSLDTFRDTEAKRAILAGAGYTQLIGPGGRRIPLSSADAARVGRTFSHTLETHERRKKR